MKVPIALMALAICACQSQSPVAPVVSVQASPAPRDIPRDRCVQYVQPVREQHFLRFGLNFPYWYSVGQLRQESSCRADAVSFDGGRGLAQFMPKTEEYVESAVGTSLDMMKPGHAIRAQAWYLAQLHKQNFAPERPLWLTYCFYNSGAGTMRKEAQRAGAAHYEAMRAACSRKVLTLKNGGTLDLCDVGYDYPKKIQKYGALYRRGSDMMPFWGGSSARGNS